MWPPAADDILIANGKTVAINVDVTCGTLQTTATGGGFTVAGATARAITANVTAGASNCIISTHTGTGANKVTITGNLTGGASGVNDCTAFSQISTGAATIIGNLTGGTSYKCKALYFNGGSIVVDATTIQGGAAAVGDVQGVLGATNAPNTVTITATNIIGGTQSEGVRCSGGSAAWTITCPNIGAGAATAIGHNGSGAMAVAGTVTTPGLTATSTGAATITGSLVSTAAGQAVSGRVYWKPASVAHYWQVALDGTSNQRYTIPPVQGNVRNGVNYGYYGEALVGGQLHLPAIADVKAGVGYGDDGTEFTGTLVSGGSPLIGPGGLIT